MQLKEGQQLRIMTVFGVCRTVGQNGLPIPGSATVSSNIEMVGFCMSTTISHGLAAVGRRLLTRCSGHCSLLAEMRYLGLSPPVLASASSICRAGASICVFGLRGLLVLAMPRTSSG